MSNAPYRDPGIVRALAQAIAARMTRPWSVMEICGGQTHAILKYGLDQLLPKELTLIHGPGCPVCVTPAEAIDFAVALAARPDVVLCTYADMLRVPGTSQALLDARAAGGDVRMVYSPLEAVTIAREHPAREIVLFAIGFETTAPGNAQAILSAASAGLANFATIVAQVTVPAALDALLDDPRQRIDGLLAAGHVCTVTGYDEYHALAARHATPIVVTGFEPVDLLRGLQRCVELLEAGRAEVANCYERYVSEHGNAAARALLSRVFAPADMGWRGLGTIPASGYRIREEFAAFDAWRKFVPGSSLPRSDAGECLAGEVLRGLKKPNECPAFGTRCTPAQPLGAPMVSGEGACAAYFRYRPPAAA
ncbi:MAG: hydrogenase formation protein HypD [Gammaproteobacteria bacterium]|nr:hydrogenase formation protein HypD [Gammaproteobacteria bacterium]